MEEEKDDLFPDMKKIEEEDKENKTEDVQETLEVHSVQ